LKIRKHGKSWLVQLAMGAKRRIDELVRGCPMDMNGFNTKADLNTIPLGSYDYLIGMDWLDKNHVVLKDGDKKNDLPYDQLDCNVGISHSNAKLEHMKLKLLEGIQHFGTRLVWNN
jgi:hypothetical protein